MTGNDSMASQLGHLGAEVAQRHGAVGFECAGPGRGQPPVDLGGLPGGG